MYFNYILDLDSEISKIEIISTNGMYERYGKLFLTTIIEGSSIRVIREHNTNYKAKQEL